MPLPRWILPGTPSRAGMILAVGTAFIGWRLLVAQGYLDWNSRLHDKVNALTIEDRLKYNAILGWLYEENGVDAHVELLPGVGEEPLEQYTVRRMRDLGIGRESGRRGLLVVYDKSDGRLRMEVGPALEGLLTDAFVGHVNREILSHHVSENDVRSGLYATLFAILFRLRRAALGDEFDTRVLGFVEDTRRLSLGAGQTTRIGSDSAGDGARAPTPAEQAYFASQPTVRAAYERYLEWMAYGGQPNDVPLFTATSVEWLDDLRMTTAFAQMSLMEEYGRKFRIEERGKVAMLFFTNDPFAQPHFFRKGKQGWQVDLIGEVLNTRNTIGGRYSWVLWESGDDFFRAFRERFVKYNGMLRLAGADNRELPKSGDNTTATVYEPPPIARTDSALEHLTVIEAADRVRSKKGRAALVILYETWSLSGRDSTLTALTGFADSVQAGGVDVLAFCIDQYDQPLHDLPGLLQRKKAPFPAIHLYRWWPGMLDSTMSSVGVPVGRQFDIPVVALVGPDGRFIGGSQGKVLPPAQKVLSAARASSQAVHQH
jgi:TLP18.3/Psb32/MOLO-1 phosphatase superfamily protein